MYATIFGEFAAVFHFKLHRGNRSLQGGTSQNFLIVNHPREYHKEREFER